MSNNKEEKTCLRSKGWSQFYLFLYLLVEYLEHLEYINLPFVQLVRVNLSILIFSVIFVDPYIFIEKIYEADRRNIISWFALVCMFSLACIFSPKNIGLLERISGVVVVAAIFTPFIFNERED